MDYVNTAGLKSHNKRAVLLVHSVQLANTAFSKEHSVCLFFFSLISLYLYIFAEFLLTMPSSRTAPDMCSIIYYLYRFHLLCIFFSHC